MGVQEDIFEEFFEKLEGELPESIIDGLRELIETDEFSQDQFFEIIKEGVNNDSND